MNTPAIYQAIRLEENPEEMAWLCFPDSDLPEGISDLLRLSSSAEHLKKFANTNDLNQELLSTALFNFIEKAMLNEKNSDDKILGTGKFASSQLQNFHYELLLQIYHPEFSTRADAEYYSSLVTLAYQRLKSKEQSNEIICFSEKRKEPKSYSHIPQGSSVTQASNTKTAVAIVSTLSIFAIVAMAGKFYGHKAPELLTANDVQKVDNIDLQQLVKVSTLNSSADLSNPKKLNNITNSQLQNLLRNLENAYEIGNIDIIKPILANTPEIQNQTDKQINDKLETLFEITHERKMLLYDFKWAAVNDTLKGKGNFLSRYKLMGEEKWLVRKGIASAIVKNENNKVTITQLNLDNQTFE